MIKANEIRIGNWVAKGVTVDLYAQITWLDFANNHDFNGVKPIPLTPEILRKAGYFSSKGNVKGTILWRIYDNNGEKRRAVQLREPSWNDDGFEIVLDINWMRVKYLHQLQNLYFDLTGEELQIRLTSSYLPMLYGAEKITPLDKVGELKNTPKND